jgi:hypothetical protein
MQAGIAGALLLGAGAIAADTADLSSNPYQGIVDRNVFALKPLPPPAAPESDKPPVPKFSLTGITTILGNKRVLFKTIPVPGKGVDVTKEESYMLAEGQRQGEVEVTSIDEIRGIVKVIYAGTAMTLDFTNNAAKAVAVAAAPAGAGAAAVPGRGSAPGIAIPSRGTAGRFGAKQDGSDNERRPIRAGGGFGMGPGPMGMAPGQAGMGFGQTQTGMAAQQAPAVITPAEQEVLMEASRSLGGPPLPPTSLTPLIEAANQEAAAGGPSANGANPATRFAPPGPPGLPPMPGGRLY